MPLPAYHEAKERKQAEMQCRRSATRRTRQPIQIFRPSALLREARRQKSLAAVDVPAVCILDPDVDIVRRLHQAGPAQPFEPWPCYHTQLDAFTLAGQTVGIVGHAVGAPFAVLVAEQLFASGCRLLLSLTSAGQITAAARHRIS
jgi:hypothetical protein